MSRRIHRDGSGRMRPIVASAIFLARIAPPPAAKTALFDSRVVASDDLSFRSIKCHNAARGRAVI